MYFSKCALVASAILGLSLLSLPSEAAAQVWNLSTADTCVTVGIQDNHPWISKLAESGSTQNWAGSGMSVPLMSKVLVEGREVPTLWLFKVGRLDAKSGKLVLTFSNDSPRMSLRSIWRARSGHGPVEHWIEIENLSGSQVTVCQQDSLCLSGLKPGGRADLWWVKRGAGNAVVEGGTYNQPLNDSVSLLLTSNCEDGASPLPWLAVQVGDKHGLYVGWEFSGLGRIHARSVHGKLEIDIGNNSDFKTDVEADETFLVPPAFVGCYAGDVDDGSYCLHRFIIEKLRPPIAKGYPDPSVNCAVYSDGGCQNSTEADHLRIAKFFYEVGCEMYMPDAVWFPAAGDWRWDPKRFPNGAKPLEDYLHKSGMRFGLWCAWTNGGQSEHPGALSVRGAVAHPDWFSSDVSAEWKPGPYYGARVCLACRDAREWAIKKTQSMVSDFKLDYLKHDCGPIVNSCTKTDHRHRYGVDVSYWSTMGYYDVMDKLRKAYPKLVLENCSGAGRIKDFGVIRCTHYTATTDTLSNLPDRTSFYDSTFAFPPLVLQAYTSESPAAKGDDPGQFLWRSAMMGAWHILPVNSASWTDSEKDSAKRAVKTYKEWIRPILKDCVVHHILPRPDGVNWDGMFYWSPSLKKGTLYIFRPESKEENKTVKLKGLDEARKYWLWGEDGSIFPGVRTGADLMKNGLKVALPGEYTSDLIYVQDESLGEPNGLEQAGNLNKDSASGRILGLTGKVSDVSVAVPAASKVSALASAHVPSDIDLKRMSAWAMNYLINTPRKDLGYEPVFQCHPLRCPPVPEGQDPVVPCDTDARMDWEWYYMREISGSDQGRDVESAFHKRMRDYITADGRVLSGPGAYFEDNIIAEYEKKNYVIHIWGASKILKSLAEDYARTGSPDSKVLAKKVMLALKKLATWDERGRCWFVCGMGAFRQDGTVMPNGWNRQPAAIVEPLVTYYLATGDGDGLDFAKAYADGMIDNCQPDGIRFKPDGSFEGHSHATMHAVWGVAHLGVVTGERKYVDFAKRVWDFMLTRGTGTGWFPAGPDSCNETCCVSDMMSTASLIGQAGHPEYYDYVERYMRNYISNLQFIVTPEFERYYREISRAAGEEKIAKGIEQLKRFQGGIIGGSGLNDYENTLLKGGGGFEMYGCCAPEGMRAIYTTWTNTIEHRPWPGVFVNMSFSRDSKWGKVVSYLPEQGRLTVKSKVRDSFFVRCPHWVARDQVHAFLNAKPVSAKWSGDYVRFFAKPGDELTITYPLVKFTHQVEGLWKNTSPDLRMTFDWLGNSVIGASPAGGRTPLFTGKPRVLPPAP